MMSEQNAGNGSPREHLKEGGASQTKSDSPNLVEQLIGLRESRANRRKINRAQLRREIVTACGLGVALMKDEAMWHSFCLADWSGIRKPPQLFEHRCGRRGQSPSKR